MGEQSEGAPAFNLDDIDDETLTARLKRMPAFADLFAEPAAAKPPAPAAPVSSGGRRRPQDDEDAMASLVTNLTAGLGRGLAEGLRGHEPPAPGAPPLAHQEPPKRRHFFFGEL